MEALLHSLLHLTENSKKQTTCMSQRACRQFASLIFSNTDELALCFYKCLKFPSKCLPEMIVTCMQMAPSSGKKHSSAAEDYGLGLQSLMVCATAGVEAKHLKICIVGAPGQQMDTIVSFQSVNAHKLNQVFSLCGSENLVI